MLEGLSAGVVTDVSLTQRITDALDEVESVFRTQLESDFPAVNDLCRHVERYRGKRLRPILTLLSGLAAAGGDPERGLTARHATLGAVIEMIHMATLVHDDVLDEAEVRRRGKTVNRLRGNETAVMLGDYLISNAFHLCSSLGDPSLNLDLGAVTNTVCEGELLQLHHRDDLSLDERTYLAIVRRKTASLVGACGRLGARLAGGSPQSEAALEAFGGAAGVAFQIQDDLLDLTGDPEIVGKTLGRDLGKGKLPLPSVLLLASAEAADRDDVLAAIVARDSGMLRTALMRFGAIEATLERARGFVREAKANLEVLPESPARDLLGSLADAVLDRSS